MTAACAAPLLAVALALPGVANSPALHDVCTSVCRAAPSRVWRAWLLTQAYYESDGFDVRVLEGVRRGDRGRARGPWQVHPWCRGARTGETRAERYDTGAWCAMYTAHVCRDPQGWFAAQAGTGVCRASWAARRTRLFWFVLGRIGA